MSRDRKAPVRKATPDAIYHSTVVEKFICRMMIDGKKSVSTRILYTAMKELGEKSGENPLDIFTKAVDNVKPVVEVKSRRVGGATYQVPVEIREERREALAMRWIIAAARARNGKCMMSLWMHTTQLVQLSRRRKMYTEWQMQTRHSATSAGSSEHYRNTSSDWGGFLLPFFFIFYHSLNSVILVKNSILFLAKRSMSMKERK